MDRDAFHTLLGGGALVADGGTGTSLIDAGTPPDACLELANVDHADRVLAVHEAFVAAGAVLVVANTFGANRVRLEPHGLATRVDELCAAGVRLAREAGARVVGGSMGPLGVRLAPYGRLRVGDAEEVYAEQAAALASAGADVLVIETQPDLRELVVAVQAARRAAPDLPILASATFTRDDRTPLGDTPEAVARASAQADVDAIGVNCGEGPAQALRILRAMRDAANDLPLSARPNAGGPAAVAGRLVYPATPDYLAELARAFLDEGATIVGGCCGTGAAHVAAVAAVVREHRPRVRVVTTPPTDVDVVTTTSLPPTRLAEALDGGRFVITVEMEPPHSFDAASLVAAATTLRDAGATAVDVADSPMAKMRMSAWAACRLIEEQADVETVLHFPTRGRNLLRLQGDLLGAHALGIRNLFVCVGDPVAIGDFPHAMNDVDVTATGLLRLISEGFNAGVDRSGAPIGEPTGFVVGAAASPAAPDLEREARLLVRKVDAGARFVLTQPVYDVAPIEALRRSYEAAAGRPLDIAVLAGVLPLVSGRHATFLHNEVPGISIPGSLRTRMDRAGDGEAAWREGAAAAADLVASLHASGVAGIYVMPQFGRYDRAAEVVEEARRRTDPA